MRGRRKVTAIANPAPKPLPDWATTTPCEQEYELSMWDSDEAVQNIHMSRDEYLALKAHLANLRGYEVPAKIEADAAQT